MHQIGKPCLYHVSTDFVSVLEELGQRVGPQTVGVLHQQLLQFLLQVGTKGRRG